MAADARRPDPRPAVYWFWNEVPSRAHARRRVAEIAAAGFGGVMIQARLSLDRERYLKPEYLRGYREAVEAALDAGLRVEVYDEYNWISGHGGGRTVRGAEHLRERHLFWTTSTAGSATATVSGIASDWIDGLRAPGARWVYEDGIRAWDEWAVVAAVAHPAGALGLDDVLDVTAVARCAGAGDGCRVSLDASAVVPEGWVVTWFVSARCATSRLINYLDPRAAQRFLEVVYEPYRQALEGLAVDGFSFDHPYGGFYGWSERHGEVGSSLMWDLEHPPLAEGSSPGVQLLALVRDVGAETVALRCRFWAAYSARGIAGFFAPLSQWTRTHGLGLTGHELLAHVGTWELYGAFPELDIRTNFGADHFAIDAARTETLVDASNFEAQLSPIMGDSVARAHGRRRCAVEQYAARRDPPEDYAAGYWELTLDELRRQTMRLHILGARRLLVHAYGSSDGTAGDDELLANPRLDFPPACNYEPWFGWMRPFCRESAMVSAFIEDGEPVREVALVFPLHTLWAHGQDHPHGRRFGEWARLLSTEGVPFDVVDDRRLDEARVEGGRLWLGEHAYGAVVLPGASVLGSRAAARALIALTAAGGTVVATDPLPAAAADGPLDGLATRLAGAAVRTGAAVGRSVPGRLLDHAAGPEVRAGGARVWHTAGRDAEGTRVVLLNDGDLRQRVSVTAAGPIRARRLSADGELLPWPWTDPGGRSVIVDLEAGEVACLHLAETTEPPSGLVTCGAFVRHLQVDGDILTVDVAGDPPPPIVRRRDGAYTTGHPLTRRRSTDLQLAEGWTLSLGDGPESTVDPGRGWELQGHPTFSGIGVYRCRFDLPDSEPADGDWTLTLPVVWCAAAASLNGVALGEHGWAPYRFDIPMGTLRATGNELTLRVASAAANHYYAGTRFAGAPQPSGLGAVPRLHVASRRYRVSLAVVEDRTAP